MENIEEEKLYWLAFSAFEGIGPKRFALLRNYFGTAKKAWQASQKKLLSTGLGEHLVSRLVQFRHEFDPRSYFVRLREKGIECYFLDQENYPESLKKIENPPFVLHVKGQIMPRDELSIAVVGNRQMTGYGGQVTESVVAELVAAGLTIVSGLARGIDTIAHQTALSAGGRTIGVLACGLDQVYPRENTNLVKEIINGKGAIVSEFPLGMQAVPGNFPARNRIISGLSLGTVVVEGGKKSGALITARHATEQGREVFAIPGPITSRHSAGPAWLIKMGAKLVFEVSDILEELGLGDRRSKAEARKVLPESQGEEIVLSLIKDEPKHVDQIIRESGIDTGEVMSLLSLMEIKGKVRSLGRGTYTINR